MTFNDMIEFRDCVMVHKLLHTADAPASLKSLVHFRADISERTTRATTDHKLHTRRCRLESTHKTAPVRAFKAWNGLPHVTRLTSNPGAFRKCVKTALVCKR